MKLQLDRRLVLAGVLIVYGFGSQLSAQPADNARTQEVRFLYRCEFVVPSISWGSQTSPHEGR